MRSCCSDHELSYIYLRGKGSLLQDNDKRPKNPMPENIGILRDQLMRDRGMYLAYVGLPGYVLQKDIVLDARVIGVVALLDMDWRIQNKHPSLLLRPQPSPKALQHIVDFLGIVKIDIQGGKHTDRASSQLVAGYVI